MITCAPMHFFHNNGDGTFSDRTAAAGLSDQLGGLNLIQADYNNDGCLDVLVLREPGRSCRSASRCCATIATEPSPM
jgi:hypothetical protein